jgi:hypothetical protein
VSLYRAIKFSRARYRDLGAARVELTKAVQAVLADGYQVENPVTNARGRFQLKEHATPSQKVFIDQLAAIEQRLSRIEAPRRESEIAQPLMRGRSAPHDPPLRVGERVFHHKFGSGDITSIEESKLTIDFPKGIKRVIDSFVERDEN